MLTNFVILTLVTTTIALIWRALLMDHTKLLSTIKKIPYIGGALSCGFCFTVWLSLIMVIIHNPLNTFYATQPVLLNVVIAWFTLSACVLFLRNLIAVLLEANGVLSHMHKNLEEKSDE